MLEIENYDELPDFLSQTDIEEKLGYLILSQNKLMPATLLSAIYELSCRQVNNYSLIDEKLREEVNKVIIALWDKSELENTELCTATIINLGLQKAYDYLRDSIDNLDSAIVKKEIEDTILEFGDSLENVSDIY